MRRSGDNLPSGVGGMDGDSLLAAEPAAVSHSSLILTCSSVTAPLASRSIEDPASLERRPQDGFEGFADLFLNNERHGRCRPK